jgi:NitT/TauT family transport system substrate-binding protein
MGRWITGIFALLGIAPLIVGCDDGTQSQSTNAGPPALVELRLGYFANVTHAQAVLGVASGDFQAALGSTQLKTKVLNAGPALIQAINAGDIDIGYIGPGPVLSAHVASNGEALRVIAGAASDGVVIVARQGSGIKTLADLKNKQIATPQLGNTQDISARHYVTAVLGQADASNVKGIPNSQQSGMMARGLIDAAWVPEPWGARLISETGATLIGQEKDLWPHGEFSLTVVVTTPQFLAQHPDVVAKFLRVHDQWTQRLNVNARQYADQLNDALAQLTGNKLPSDVLLGALDHTKFTDDPMEDTFATMGQWSYDLKFIKSPPDLKGLFETDIVRGMQSEPAKGQ